MSSRTLSDTEEPPNKHVARVPTPPIDVFQRIAVHCDPKTYRQLAQTSKVVRARLCTRIVWEEHLHNICDQHTEVLDTGQATTWFTLANTTVKHGPYVTVNSQGVCTLLAHYDHGELHGTNEQWNDQCVRTLLSHYEHGELHGTIECWNNQGVRTWLAHYDHGELHGTVEQWNDRGDRILLAHYDRGESHGTASGGTTRASALG